MTALRTWAPLLLLAGATATAPDPSTCGGLAKEVIEVPVRGDHSDAFEYKSTGMTYRGNMGEVYVGRSVAHGNIISALRFGGVRVPRDSRIIAASVQLADAHAGDVCCKGTDLTVLLAMERTVDSTPLPLHHTPGWLLSRLQVTGSLTWNPPAAGTYDRTETPNLRAMVQSLVTMKGWASGNAITLLMDGNGTVEDVDERVYFGSGVSHEHRAKLRISYCEPQLEPPPLVVPNCPKCITNATISDGVVLMDSEKPAVRLHIPVIPAVAVFGLLGAVLASVASLRPRRGDCGSQRTAPGEAARCSQRLPDETKSFLDTSSEAV